MYYRRPPRRRPHHYMMPFIVIIILILALVFGWKFISNRWGGGADEEVLSNCVELDITSGSAKAITATGDGWKTVPDNIKLCQDERIQTSIDGRSQLNFFEGSVLSLNTDTEVLLETLKRRNFSNTINVEVTDGEVWATIERSNSPDSSFTITTEQMRIKARNAVLAIEAPGSLYVMDGNTQVEVLNEKGKAVKEFSVGLGQQLILDAASIGNLEDGQDAQVLFALSDRFKESGWYRYNTEGDLSDLENLTDDENADTEGEVMTDTETPEATESTTTTTTNEKDTTPPKTPIITEPGENGDVVEIDDISQSISGEVSSDTAAVIVNDYRLSKFAPGDTSFNYVANIAFQNLVIGENEYKVIAEDAAGNQSKAAIITLVLPQSVYDEKINADEDAESTTEATTTESEAKSASSSTPASGGVLITDPNGGSDLDTSDTEFEIKGTVPEGTASVEVNDYKLQLFEAGSTTFTYRAYASIGNLEIGQKNRYVVKVYNKDGELLGTDEITINVQSGASQAPVISIPVSSTSYTTTLDTIVLGGTVGKWVDRVYINDTELTEYIPGSEEWRTTVTLDSGANTFTVKAERDGSTVGSDTIEINLE